MYLTNYFQELARKEYKITECKASTFPTVTKPREGPLPKVTPQNLLSVTVRIRITFKWKFVQVFLEIEF